jgi:two-component system, cell cycle response regulator
MGTQAGAVAVSPPPSQGTARHVLVADPDPAGRSSLCAILRAGGIPARPAETAEEVLAATGADTVLLSLDGSPEERLELIRRLRERGPRRPAVVVVSERSRDLLPRALDAGADDYLLGPPRPDELIARLGVVAGRRRLEAEREMARTDPLTGLLNRGAFRERLDEEVSRATRHRRLLSLALLDIDHLGLVNERCGRSAGDRTLAALAALARSHSRETDVIGRVGGGEFAWLMPETDLVGAEQAAERLRAFVAATPTCGGRVTASLGVAEQVVGGSAEDFLASVVAAMRAAKEAGRNRVRTQYGVTAEGAPPAP